MALSDYAGTTLDERDETIVRAVPHRLWRPGEEQTELCAHSGERLDLSERHLLVVLERDGTRERIYFRDESSLAAWVREQTFE